MIDPRITAIAQDILCREALYLDRQQWDAWLDLYADEIIYWVPAWKSEGELVDNVRREVSLIYHTRRSELAERVFRIRSRKSVTAMPLPRTTHLVSNMLVEESSPAFIRVAASWVVHEYDPRVAKQHTHFGRYEYDFRQICDAWKIARKKTILMNDLIPTVIDFYNL